jgi:hypothetical protein
MNYTDIVSLVIDKLEGGYYHPNMLKDGRVKDARYSASGETMFGIDRLKGGSINSTAAGKRFWMIIDNANAANTWKWNYKGGALGKELKQLAAEMIKPLYMNYSKNYLTTDAIAKINSSSSLLFHFIYATWNGIGWFKKFANDITGAMSRGLISTEQLEQVALNSRLKEGLTPNSQPNSLIAQGGKKIQEIFKTIKTPVIVATPLIFVGILLFLMMRK